MMMEIDKEIKLKQLTQSDADDIFRTIDNEKEYLGKWLPFIEFIKEISDTGKFVD